MRRLTSTVDGLSNSASNTGDAAPSTSSSAASEDASATNGNDAGAGDSREAGPPAQPLPTSFTKHLLDLGTYPDARCNDGTAAGYYPVSGSGSGSAVDAKTWVVFLEGGSWCASDAECASRPANLSSSGAWATSIAPSGILSADISQNPHFSSFNRVDVPYCSSDVFSGDEASPAAGKFQFRGRAVIDAVVGDLKVTYGFGAPGSTVLLAGASAGGVAVLVTADRIAAALPGVKVVALADRLSPRRRSAHGPEHLGAIPNRARVLEWIT